MEKLKKIHDGVWKAAYEIIDKKRATYYGIGMALNRLVKAVLNDENAILTVSTYQNGEYGQEGLYIGVPAIINKNGVKEILKLKLSKEDQAKFDHSCDIMKENIKNEIEINTESITSEATYASYVESYKDKFENWKGTVR